MQLLVIAAVANVALAYSNTQPLVAWSSSRYPFFIEEKQDLNLKFNPVLMFLIHYLPNFPIASILILS